MFSKANDTSSYWLYRVCLPYVNVIFTRLLPFSAPFTKLAVKVPDNDHDDSDDDDDDNEDDDDP